MPTEDGGKYRAILLFGPPGAGKGTQGAMLGAVPGFHHVSSGDIFRNLDKQSELGQLFLSYSTRGELVPDDVTIRICTENLAARTVVGLYRPARDLLVLDGLPRTVNQASVLSGSIDVLGVVRLVADDRSAMTARLKHRALQEKRPDDADEKVIQNRLDVYERETAPVLGHYPPETVHAVSAMGSPASVLRGVLEAVVPILDGHFENAAGA
ncbi:MAG: nucleoside monophosphate kinase [Planctomycetota bacterium]